ncbi:hypothetical protein F3Y22_tig00000329pilonHSYRG00071 [Hibiscus syriacus]|uniref:Uncharacterized protein n=1 Tax=Hibiscus syriacus TaxID=106335 RepID=A0A6A3D5I8_HIBSY|nr:hypothetical protein F3Y22_tig00000329pilonHSYRG00071 [Hibiscus syriacus]
MKIGKGSKLQKEIEDASESWLGNPDIGPLLLKQARDLVSSGDNPSKDLQLTLQAAKSYELCAIEKPSLELVMCLLVTVAIYCGLGQYNEALGDTYAMLGHLDKAITCYTTGLEVVKQVLGETDPSVGETCRFLAEAYVQALQFDEVQKLCQMAFDIHRENGSLTNNFFMLQMSDYI